MRVPAGRAGVAALVVMLLASSEAGAGTTSPLSSIAVLPGPQRKTCSNQVQ